MHFEIQYKCMPKTDPDTKKVIYISYILLVPQAVEEKNQTKKQISEEKNAALLAYEAYLHKHNHVASYTYMFGSPLIAITVKRFINDGYSIKQTLERVLKMPGATFTVANDFEQDFESGFKAKKFLAFNEMKLYAKSLSSPQAWTLEEFSMLISAWGRDIELRKLILSFFEFEDAHLVRKMLQSVMPKVVEDQLSHSVPPGNASGNSSESKEEIPISARFANTLLIQLNVDMRLLQPRINRMQYNLRHLKGVPAGQATVDYINNFKKMIDDFNVKYKSVRQAKKADLSYEKVQQLIDQLKHITQHVDTYSRTLSAQFFKPAPINNTSSNQNALPDTGVEHDLEPGPPPDHLLGPQY